MNTAREEADRQSDVGLVVVDLGTEMNVQQVRGSIFILPLTTGNLGRGGGERGHPLFAFRETCPTGNEGSKSDRPRRTVLYSEECDRVNSYAVKPRWSPATWPLAAQMNNRPLCVPRDFNSVGLKYKPYNSATIWTYDTLKYTHSATGRATCVRSQRPHSLTADDSPFMSLPATGSGSGTASRGRFPVPLTSLAPGALLFGGRDASAAGASTLPLRIFSARSFSSAAPMMDCSAACLDR